MPIETHQSLAGRIASDPELSETRFGDSRFHARIALDHYQLNDDGSFTELDTTFHSMVIYKKTAEHAFQQFSKGDAFLAQGNVKQRQYVVDGETRVAEQFEASRIGHDTARTNYVVDRTPRQEIDQQAATVAQGHTVEQQTTNQGPEIAPASASSHEASHDSPEPAAVDGVDVPVSEPQQPTANEPDQRVADADSYAVAGNDATERRTPATGAPRLAPFPTSASDHPAHRAPGPPAL